MSISMHIQNLDKFDKRVLKILSENKIWRKSRTITLVQMCEKFRCNNPKLDLVYMDTYIKFGKILSMCSPDIERKRNFGINQGP